jgi:hypothetical protein
MTRPRPARAIPGTRLAPAPGRPSRRRRGLVVAAVSSAAAATAAITVAGGTAPQGTATGGAVIRLAADYQLRLPTGFTVGKTSATCRPFVFVAERDTGRRGPDGLHVYQLFQVKVPTYADSITATSSASGGCVNVLLTQPFRLTGGSDPQAYAGERQVRVGHYHGWIRSYWAVSGRHAPYRIHERVTQLNVQLPDGHGRIRDLLVASTRLSLRRLIYIVARGLASR